MAPPLLPQVQKSPLSRYEVGGQFAAFNVSLFKDLSRVEPGFGGAFALNVNRLISLDSSLAFYPVDYNGHFEISTIYGGKTLSGAAGLKIGFRRQSWGLFGKARPGFIRFSRVGDLGPSTGTSSRTYPMIDFGPAVEFYPARRIVLRTDFGIEMIHFSYRSLTLPGGVGYSTLVYGWQTQPAFTTSLIFRFGRQMSHP